MTNNDRLAFDAAFWFQWIVATTLGWVLGSLIFPNLSIVSAGVGVGVLQWPVLVGRFPRT
jgi:predicted branched-subunit amino acid permease